MRILLMVYFENKGIGGEYHLKVNSPRKREDDCLHIIIPKGSITSSKKKLSEGYIELALSRKYKKEVESLIVDQKLRFQKIYRIKS